MIPTNSNIFRPILSTKNPEHQEANINTHPIPIEKNRGVHNSFSTLLFITNPNEKSVKI